MSVAESERQRFVFVERLEDPPVAEAPFEHVRWSWLWLILRLYAGWQWLQAGLFERWRPPERRPENR